MEFRILGPLEVSDGERLLSVGGPRERAVLAFLLLRANEVVSADQLVDELWGADPPRRARASLQTAVSRLRKVLPPGALVSRAPGYVLIVGPAELDLARFEQLVAEARPAAPEERGARLHEALALWRGAPLADLAYEAFAQTEAARLEELRLTVLEERVEADLALGRHAAIAGELEALVAEHPLRERLRAQLMLALYRAGRQAEALEAYAEARRLLDRELGLEPGDELQRLQRAILTHDRELQAPASAPAPAALEAPPPAPDAGPVRKTVTVLFADVAGWTSIGERLDAEPFHRVLSRYREVTAAVVERHGGTVEKFAGDAVMAVFGVPELHEDDALRAARAALDLRTAVATLSSQLERDYGVILEVAIGINTGGIVSGLAGPGLGLAGDPINVASRLQEAAQAGEILIGGSTQALLQHTVVAEPLEPLSVKGRRQHVPVWRMLGTTTTVPAVVRSDAGPFVNRVDELDELRSTLALATEERSCRLCTVLGPPGIGKSRLTHEFLRSIDGKARVVVGRCLPYGEGITYWPLGEIVRELDGDDPAGTVRGVLGAEDRAEAAAERIAGAIGAAETAGDAEETAWAFRKLFEGLARERPLVAVIDDVHWAEPTLLDLLDYLTGFSAGAPILVLTLARPDLLEARPAWSAPQPGRALLQLQPLSQEHSSALLAGLGAELSAPEQAVVLETAEGNPLFLEQLAAFRAEDDRSATSLPPTVQALLATRIERLPPGPRAVLGHAAVEGRTFHQGALTELVPEPLAKSLQAHLLVLIRRGFVSASRSELPGEEAFRFRHMLIRDAAYEAMPKKQRAELHERFAGWLEQKAGERAPEFEELLGYHLEQAYRLRTEVGPIDEHALRLAALAGERLASAGLRASKRIDDAAAVNLLGRATSLLPVADRSRAELLCELALALQRAGRLADADEALDDAVHSSKAAGDERVELRARIERASAGLFGDPKAKPGELLELAEQGIPVFEETGDERSLGRAWVAIGYVHMFRGEIAAWEAAEERAWTHLRAGWSLSAGVDIAAAAFQGPRPVSGVVSRLRELLRETSGHLRADADVVAFLGGLEGMLGRFKEGRRHVARARAIYEEFGDRRHVATAWAAMKGLIETLAGDLAAAESAWREGCEILREIGDVSYLSSHAAELADVLYARGCYEEADTYGRLSEERAATDDVYTQILWRIARSKTTARLGPRAEAEVLAREGVELASNTDALVLTGRAQLALAEVLELDGRPPEAAEAARGALEMFRRKGDVVSARRARALVRRLGSEGASPVEPSTT